MAGQDPREIPTEADVSTAARQRVIVFWDGGFAAFALPASGKAVIGRLKECEVSVDHPSVSRTHAELLVGSEMRVVDLGSFNGTRVGGVRIAPNEPVPIPPGSVVEIGSTFLVFERASVREGAPAPGDPSERARRAQAGDAGPELVVVDERMKQLHRLLASVAQGTISVLFLGETGVGKEMLAQAIHRYSPRASRPFVSINCAAIPEALLESELFGHERGAFTGAAKEKIGLLEAAAGGTLFLDEIGEMPMPAQAKLLRAIEQREVVRVGGIRPRPVDVRFVSATNRDLEALIAARMFRRDLFFRLNGISVTIPPLRERAGELESMARRFLAEFGASLGRRGLALSPSALAALRRHSWPGNVRELRNVIERAALLCAGQEILPEHLALVPLAHDVPPASGVVPDAGDPAYVGLSDELSAMERKRILEALDRCAGNQTRAASLLGISRRALISRLETYGMPRPRKR